MARKVLMSNFFYLGIYQGLNFLFPLLISPYLIKTIGLNNFGLITSVQALMTFFTIFCDYGFNMSATKEISMNKDHHEIINNIINSVFIIKIIIVILSSLILWILVISIHKFSIYSILYLFSFALPLGRAFFPIWFFQGIQKMQYLILFSLFSKGLAAILLITFIHKPSDSYLVNLFIGFMDFLGTLLMIIFVYKIFNFKIYIPESRHIIQQTKNGFYLFLASFFANLTANSNLVILSFFVKNDALGIFSVADRIVFMIKQLPTIIFQAIYPHACRLWVNSRIKFLIFIKKMFWGIFLLLTFISIIVSILSKHISLFFSKTNSFEIGSLLSIMCFLPIIAGLNLPAYLGILVTEQTRLSSRVIIIAAIINIIFNFIFTSIFGYWGTLLTIALTDICITVSHNFIIIFRTKGYNFFKV
ncbi:oligosaccharide flippase family protein [Hydrotalea sp.]|uniref:oligosaccharide flippase family protein n=1 Tax=Hydrotalea sp. TaxID=2881279 RepID=UPI003D0E5A4D